MSKNIFCQIRTVFFIILGLSYLISCETNSDNYDEVYKQKEPPYVFTGEYKMIKVPVPEGGIEFPIGINDDQTARVEKAFYISEILVTQALWDTVARWAMNEKEVGKYYGLFYEHYDIADLFYPNYFVYIGGDLPILDDHSHIINAYYIGIGGEYVVPTWCNAFTEWYNEKYGTNFTTVYTDEYGNPKRGIDNYDYVRATKGRTGFRLPTPEEWELAARWNGNDATNTVNTTINGINFAEYPFKFTKGNSASGARTTIENLNECSRVAVFSYNSFLSPVKGKTKAPNALGIYDMSGNLPEFVINYWTDSEKSIRTYRGGAYNSKADELAIARNGSSIYGGLGGFGIRLVRNAE